MKRNRIGAMHVIFYSAAYVECTHTSMLLFSFAVSILLLPNAIFPFRKHLRMHRHLVLLIHQSCAFDTVSGVSWPTVRCRAWTQLGFGQVVQGYMSTHTEPFRHDSTAL